VLRQFERPNSTMPRNEAALEEIRRLFARYRARPEQSAQRAERRDREESRAEPAGRSSAKAAP
jgi:hypothetical protein